MKNTSYSPTYKNIRCENLEEKGTIFNTEYCTDKDQVKS